MRDFKTSLNTGMSKSNKLRNIIIKRGIKRVAKGVLSKQLQDI